MYQTNNLANPVGITTEDGEAYCINCIEEDEIFDPNDYEADQIVCLQNASDLTCSSCGERLDGAEVCEQCKHPLEECTCPCEICGLTDHRTDDCEAHCNIVTPDRLHWFDKDTNEMVFEGEPPQFARWCDEQAFWPRVAETGDHNQFNVLTAEDLTCKHLDDCLHGAQGRKLGCRYCEHRESEA